ncbi:hypothetical protein AURDEDRAFT_168682 [Auricularia subglabra TFB-10046 SS5]|nr:hypothetical protein AURDEDRAFT_168682 [Auricularia subglabra TFB-10046 SS5]
MRGNPKWATLMRLFVFLKAKMAASDALDASADVPAVVMYIREQADEHEFRARLFRMRNRAVVFCGPFYEALAYSAPPGSRKAKRLRAIVPENVPLPPRSPTPKELDLSSAPPYRARHYRALIGQHCTEDWSTPIREVAFAAYFELKRLIDHSDAILKIIKGKYPGFRERRISRTLHMPI